MHATAPPLVSIVLPTYNGARYLQHSIDSCLGQSYDNIELIVVVDGSTDCTGEILNKICDPRLRTIWHEQNCGLPETLNTGFRHTRGELLTWTSDDNWYAPDAIAEMVNYLMNRPSVAFVYTDMWLVDEAGNVREQDVLPPDHLASQPWNGIGACFMYWRKVYETIGDYDPAARLAEDYDYWLRIAQHFDISVLRRRLYYYRQHSQSLSSTFGSYRAASRSLQVRRKHKLMNWREYLVWSAYLDVDAAFWHWQRGEWSGVRHMGVQGLVKNPANFRNIGLLSILVEAMLGAKLAAGLRRSVRGLRRASRD